MKFTQQYNTGTLEIFCSLPYNPGVSYIRFQSVPIQDLKDKDLITTRESFERNIADDFLTESYNQELIRILRSEENKRGL